MCVYLDVYIHTYTYTYIYIDIHVHKKIFTCHRE